MVARIFTLHGISLGLLLLFAMNSFPMMYPGYDIWWHLDVIRSIEYFDGQSYGRWHWLWNKVLGLVGMSDLFLQALVIHRTQFVISLVCLYSSALLLMFAVLKGRLPNPSLAAVLAFFSVITWFLMHGTASEAPYVGADSAVTMSWINWYSVSHQIALPFCVLSISLMIAAAVPGVCTPGIRWLFVFLSFIFVVAVALLHAAEVPYFLFMAVAGVVLYARLKNFVSLVLISGSAVLMFAALFGGMSHGESQLLMRILSGEFDQILVVARHDGDLMLAGLNRAATSWNALYTFLSLLLLALLVVSVVGVIRRRHFEFRSILWIASSVLLPASIFFKYSAGLVAQITYLTLAWRFSFGSLLFVVPAVYTALVLAFRDGEDRLRLFLLVIVVPSFCLLASLMLSDSKGVLTSNLTSLVATLDKERMHFDVSRRHIDVLTKVADRVRDDGSLKDSCFDLFSVYYLYFILDAKNICLPRRIAEGPTYLMSVDSGGLSASAGACDCGFSKLDAPVELRNARLSWNYRLLK